MFSDQRTWGFQHRFWAVRLDASGDITGLETGGRFSGGLARRQNSAPTCRPPLAYDGLLYVCRDNGVLSVYESRTGELVYRERIKAGTRLHGFDGGRRRSYLRHR